MRILLVIKRFDFGGAENHVCDLANSLYELGNEVYLVADKGRQLSRLNDGVKFIDYRLSDFLIPLNVLFLYRLIKKHKIDVIHAHQRLAIQTAGILKKFINIPLVVTVHGRTRFDLKTKLAKTAPDRIIFVSKQVLEVSACYEYIKYKSVVIPNGIELSENDLIDSSPSFTYVSRMDKNHSKVILMLIQQVLPKLLKDYPEFRFNLIGEGNCSDQIKNSAIKLNAEFNREVCKIWDYQPDAKEIFRNSSLVLGVGRVALEAIACGVPVLSINKKRFGTIITPANYPEYKVNNFVAIDNNAPKAEELYELLNNFFSDIDKWRKDTKIVRDLVNTDFNQCDLTRTIIETYDDAISSKKKSQR